MAEETKTTGEAPQEDPSNPARRRSKPPVKFQPPLMPLIDVMFTLMMFFLVTCQYRQKEGALPTALPTFGGPGVTTDKPPAKPITLLVSQVEEGQDVQPRFRVDMVSGQVDSEEELFNKLESLKEKLGSTENPVIIKAANEGVQWHFVVQAFNQVLRSRFKNVAFGVQE